jgi:hypothetical protein
MGRVRCVGTLHGGNCPAMHKRDVLACWGCDRCPKRYGFRLGRGDYCPDCVADFKARGYVWSDYYGNYVSREDATHGEHERTAHLIREAHEKRLLGEIPLRSSRHTIQ